MLVRYITVDPETGTPETLGHLEQFEPPRENEVTYFADRDKDASGRNQWFTVLDTFWEVREHKSFNEKPSTYSRQFVVVMEPAKPMHGPSSVIVAVMKKFVR